MAVALPDDACWNQAFEFNFENATDSEAFANHPVHGEFVERRVHPYADTAMSVDYDDVATALPAPPEQRRAS